MERQLLFKALLFLCIVTFVQPKATGMNIVQSIKKKPKMPPGPPKPAPKPPPPEPTTTETSTTKASTTTPMNCNDFDSVGMWKFMEVSVGTELDWDDCNAACGGDLTGLPVLTSKNMSEMFGEYAYSARVKRGFSAPDPGVWIAFKQTAEDFYDNGGIVVEIPRTDIDEADGFHNVQLPSPSGSQFLDASTPFTMDGDNQCFVVDSSGWWYEESCSTTHRCFCECAE